jgi:hypothetical protein
MPDLSRVSAAGAGWCRGEGGITGTHPGAAVVGREDGVGVTNDNRLPRVAPALRTHDVPRRLSGERAVRLEDPCALWTPRRLPSARGDLGANHEIPVQATCGLCLGRTDGTEGHGCRQYRDDGDSRAMYTHGVRDILLSWDLHDSRTPNNMQRMPCYWNPAPACVIGHNGPRTG